MAEPNLPLNVPYKDHGQYEGVDDTGRIEDPAKAGFSQTFRGRGRRDVPTQGLVTDAAMRYAENED